MSSRVAIAVCALSLIGGIIVGFIPKAPRKLSELDKELSVAVQRGDSVHLKKLLSKHPDINWSSSEASPSLLGIAIGRLMNEQYRVKNYPHIVDDQRPAIRETINLLLDAGADPNEGNGYLVSAVYLGDVDLMKALISRGGRARYRIRPDYTFYWLDYKPESLQKFEECLVMAQKAGFDLNSRDYCGRTKLHGIIGMQYPRSDLQEAMVEIMVKHGMDVNAKDCLGMTPYDYAQTEETQTWLAGIGAKPSK